MASVRRDDETGAYGVTSGNFAAVDAYEPGSVAKVITIASSLSEGLVTPETSYVVPWRKQYYDDLLKDSHEHPDEVMSVAQILTESSNIGTIFVQQEMGRERHREYMAAFGLGSKTALDGGTGRRRGRDRALGGTRSVDTEQAAIQTTEMMRNVVCRGTATRAQVDGLSIAGKTGTAFKAADNGTYFDDDGNRIYYASFVGFFPAENPQVTVLVSVDEPPAGTNDRFGGTAAAPVFASTPTLIHHELGVVPTPGASRLPAAVSSSMLDAVGSPGSDRTGLHELRTILDRGVVVDSVVHDPRRVVPGSLYACLRGEHFDGHTLARATRCALEPRHCSPTTTSMASGPRRSSSTTPGDGWARSPPRSPATRAAP